jgi:Holliday junction resolvase RusA-like endonuclease
MTAALTLPTGSAPLDGPWRMAFWAAVPGDVRSKSNYRRGGATKWGDVKTYEDRVYAHVRAARPSGWVLDKDSAVAVKDRHAVVAVMIGRTLLDTGNLSKSTLDACEGLLFLSDAQVIACVEAVERTRAKPGLLLACAQLEPGAQAADGLTAAMALTAQVAPLLT